MSDSTIEDIRDTIPSLGVDEAMDILWHINVNLVGSADTSVVIQTIAEVLDWWADVLKTPDVSLGAKAEIEFSLKKADFLKGVAEQLLKMENKFYRDSEET